MTLAVALASCSAPSSPTLPGIADAMQPYIASGDSAGFVTVVADRDGLRHVQSQGLADIAGARPMTADTLFWIASMTKPVTGVAVMMMVDEGRLALADPVAKYIPEFAALRTPSGAPANLTLEQLLNHTSGLADLPRGDAASARTLADLIPLYLALPMNFEPGAKWQYCQSSINTAARVVEIVSGERFDVFLEKRLFQPLGMKDTTFYPDEAQRARLATSYRKDPASGGLVVAEARFDLSTRERPPLANGGLYSTPRDYAQFARMLLRRGELDGRRYLSEAAVAALVTDRTREIPAGFVPGSAWGVATILVREPQGVTAGLSAGSFGHGGAWGTQAWVDPVRGVAHLLFYQRADIGNGDGSPMRGAFHDAVARALGD
ncbi:MAG: beta-lactamase family protein [Opitutaceae bacterium]|nr:beta-lactamase family protein [Opitutaceae bacterium]